MYESKLAILSLQIRFIFDILLIFFLCDKCTFQISMIFSRLNKLAHTTKFKVEWVDLGKLPFHGVLPFIVNGWIKFSAYRKPTQTANNLHLS